MTDNEKYNEFLKGKLNFEEYKNENYPKFFTNRLTKYVQKHNYDYNDFQYMMNDKFDHEYTPEGLMNLLVIKDDLGEHMENYINVVGDKFAGIFYLFLSSIPRIHDDTIDGLISSHRIYEVEKEQEFKWKNKLS